MILELKKILTFCATFSFTVKNIIIIYAWILRCSLYLIDYNSRRFKLLSANGGIETEYNSEKLLNTPSRSLNVQKAYLCQSFHLRETQFFLCVGWCKTGVIGHFKCQLPANSRELCSPVRTTASFYNSCPMYEYLLICQPLFLDLTFLQNGAETTGK